MTTVKAKKKPKTKPKTTTTTTNGSTTTTTATKTTTTTTTPRRRPRPTKQPSTSNMTTRHRGRNGPCPTGPPSTTSTFPSTISSGNGRRIRHWPGLASPPGHCSCWVSATASASAAAAICAAGVFPEATARDTAGHPGGTNTAVRRGGNPPTRTTWRTTTTPTPRPATAMTATTRTASRTNTETSSDRLLPALAMGVTVGFPLPRGKCASGDPDRCETTHSLAAHKRYCCVFTTIR
mmetsp:Transcript_7162/g.17984  ORF Transcript_7162/g.17984 Transcript_7162/m.17984 type:complete len:236 (+) Transcript_7162:324-1031(+)